MGLFFVDEAWKFDVRSRICAVVLSHLDSKQFAHLCFELFLACSFLTIAIFEFTIRHEDRNDISPLLKGIIIVSTLHNLTGELDNRAHVVEEKNTIYVNTRIPST